MIIKKVQIQQYESIIFTCFVAYNKHLELLQKTNLKGKKILENILDNLSSKQIIQKAKFQNNEQIVVQLYRSTIAKLNDENINLLAKFVNIVEQFDLILQKMYQINEKLQSIQFKHNNNKIQQQQSIKEFEYVFLILQTIELIKRGTQSYVDHQKTIQKIVNEYQSYLLQKTKELKYQNLKYGLLLWIYSPMVVTNFNETFADNYNLIYKTRNSSNN